MLSFWFEVLSDPSIVKQEAEIDPYDVPIENFHIIPPELYEETTGEIQKQFPDEYQSVDDVYKTFLNAHFTGRLLPLARLVEKTFGEGSFRLLGNMDTDGQSGVLHLQSLKKARMRQMRQAKKF